MLFGNVVIRQVNTDAAAGTLLLRALYADREYQNIAFEGVYYSQIDERVIGSSIFIAEEVGPEELMSGAHQSSMSRMMEDCGGQADKLLKSLVSRGHRIYLHYADKNEYIVVAKRLKVE